MITRSYNAGSKTLAAITAETIVWNSSDIPGTGVEAYHINLTGTDNDFDSLTRIRVKAGASTIWDVNELQHAALVQRYTKKAGPGATATRFTIPFFRLGGNEMDGRKYMVGFPNGQAPTIEMVKDATGAAGTAFAGWTINSEPTQFYPMYIGSQGNIAASVTNGRIPLTNKGLLKGICVPDSADVNRLKVVASGQELINMSSAQLLETEELEQGGTVTTNIFLDFETMLPLTPGNSYIELDTAAGWGGVAEEFAVLTLVPQGQ